MSQVSAESLSNVTPIESRRSAGSLLLPAAELLVVLGLVEFDLWYLRGSDSPLLHATVYGTIGLVIWLNVQRRARHQTAVSPGATAGRAWGESLLVLGLATLALLVAAWLLRDKDEGFRFYFRQRTPWELLTWLTVRIVGAVAQQLGLQFIIGPACREILRPGAVAVCAAGLLFGILHLPHPILVTMTVVMGAAWVFLFGRSGRLAPVIMCHAIVSILATGTLPRAVISDMDIGMPALDQMIHPRYRCTEDVREAVQLVKSQAYYARQGGTPHGFVEGIFFDFLGRSPTQDELDKWLIELSQSSRARAAVSIFKSKSFDKVRVRTIARSLPVGGTDDVARRQPDDAVRR